MNLFTANPTSLCKHAQQHGSTSSIMLAAIAAFAIGIAVYAYQHIKKNSANIENLQKAVSLNENPRELPNFSMTNHLGSEFSNKDLNNKWSFIFFGFTHCPDVCPITLSVLDQASSKLEENIKSQTILISVDPKRDTPEKLKEYVSHFNHDMIGLTGSNEQLKSLTQSLGAIYSIPNDEDENYLVDHSAHIFVIAPDGKLTALFSTPHDANVIADDFKIINSAYNQKQKS